MKKKVFKNGQAPYICDIELNELQDWIEEEINTQVSGIKEMIKDELYYKPGDSETFIYVTGGHLTSSATQLVFTVVLPKRLDNVTPKIVSGTLSVRTPSGGYLKNEEPITQGNTPIFHEKNKNILTIGLQYSEKLNIANNIVLGIHISNLKIDFT